MRNRGGRRVLYPRRVKGLLAAGFRGLSVGIALAFVSGCGNSNDEPDEARLFDAVAEPLDRADDVQRIVDEQAEELRRRLEEAEGR